MPQKTRKEKERAAQRRESGQIKTPVAPAPIEAETPNPDTGLTINVPSAPTRRPRAAAVMAQSAQGEFDYGYVYTDLRRIAILAVVCFGIMIALAFVFQT